MVEVGDVDVDVALVLAASIMDVDVVREELHVEVLVEVVKVDVPLVDVELVLVDDAVALEDDAEVELLVGLLLLIADEALEAEDVLCFMRLRKTRSKWTSRR